MNKLIVWWEGRLVGELVKRAGGSVQFSYDPSWLSNPDAPALSVSLPKVAEPFPMRSAMTFFDGLLPEGQMREAMAKVTGLSVKYTYGLLDSAGGDVAGAIQLLPEGNLPSTAATTTYANHALSDEALLELLDGLPLHPMLSSEKGLRLSLAGAQAKAAVVLVNGRVAKPIAGQPTTHILKPAIRGYKGIVENEGFCMRLARVIGLETAVVEPMALELPNREPRKYLLVERYDRALVNGFVVRLHQEDFCQALGFPVAKKYQSDKGPGFRECFDLLDRVSTEPAKDRMRLLDAAIFNLMVGNSDAHSKNFSILHGLIGKGGIRLAPLYDILSTAPYVDRDLDQRFAMKIGHARTLEDINPRDWREFTEKVGVTNAYLKSRVVDLAERVIAAVDGVVFDFERLDRVFLRGLAETVASRAKRCVSTF